MQSISRKSSYEKKSELKHVLTVDWHPRIEAQQWVWWLLHIEGLLCSLTMKPQGPLPLWIFQLRIALSGLSFQ